VAFERLRFDTFVLGVCGIDKGNGVTIHGPADACVKRAAGASCGRTFAVADPSKLGGGFAYVCSLSAVDRLVTDVPPSATAPLEAFWLTVERV
jgi:DeoR/GlpR family transcriptional regulator of sugar metabolism